MTDTDRCLTSEELATLIEGRAEADEREVWMRHLDHCKLCRAVLAGSARRLSGDETG